ncbi:MAG TPA: hypothetical protein VGD10_06835 [Allosphingosinicella sp.]|uniref:hypothetical protein n=1 Tax=Allosphingosinicella sp. TaxID=2823234 RepID=UPI002EDB5CD6
MGGRILLGLAALGLLAGGIVHAAAFPKAATQIGEAKLTPFLSGSFKALWLIDSMVQLLLALLLTLVLFRPAIAGRPTLVILGLVPLGTAVLITIFLGGFPAIYLLAGCALATIVGGLLHEAGATSTLEPTDH